METDHCLLEALRAALEGGTVTWEGCCALHQWKELERLADLQHVLPLVVDAACSCPDFLALPGEEQQRLRQRARKEMMGQARKDQIFLSLYGRLLQAGFRPLVLKGMAVRSCYPKPELRPSNDEDLLVPEADFFPLLCWLEDHGYVPDREVRPEDFELGMFAPEGLYVEVHRLPFAPDSQALAGSNQWVCAGHADPMELHPDGNSIWTLSPQRHLLYLLLHAFKHLIHSGVGIRQVCDVVMWARQYGKTVDWPWILDRCRELGCGKFPQAALQVGVQELGLDPEQAGIPAWVLQEPLPLASLLQDLVEGGVYGSATASRQHSSTLTVEAVEADRRGRRASLLKTVFPPRSTMTGRYPYVQKWPVLLPVAWASRLGHYASEVRRSGQKKQTTESLEIAAHRTQLLRDLEIIG